MLKSKLHRKTLLAQFIICTATVLTGCGRQAYVVTTSTLHQEAPGTYDVAPKVDIAFFEDNSGSRFAAQEQIVPQLREFMKSLQDQRWDYHFLSSPISIADPTSQITQAIASRFDSNWGSLWIPPYPGATRKTPGTLLASIFRTPDTFTGFVAQGQISNVSHGTEPAFQTIMHTLTRRVDGTHFVREGLLVMIVLSNDDDTSNMETDCVRGDGLPVPCPGAGATSFENYRIKISALKPNLSQIRFYSLVAQNDEANCLGGPARPGIRYRNMSLALGGQSYDICRTPFSTIFSSLSTHLQQIRLGYKSQYAFMQNPPEESQLHVFLSRNGTQTELRRADATETFGWKYVGYQTNVPTIIEPIPMNYASGYAVKIFGDDRPVGNDSITIRFYPEGARDSVAD